MLRPVIALIAALGLSLPAVAGTRATYRSASGEQLQIEIADSGDVRVGDPAREDYGVMKGTDFYMVSRTDGRWHVATLDNLASAFDQLVPPIFKGLLGAVAPKPDSTLEIVTKGTRSVAGFTGTVFEISGMGDRTIEAVVSNDPDLAPLGRAMGRFIEATYVLSAPMLGSASADLITDSRQLFALGTPLEAQDGFKMEKFEQADIPAARTALPAAPATVDQIVSAMRDALPIGR